MRVEHVRRQGPPRGHLRVVAGLNLLIGSLGLAVAGHWGISVAPAPGTLLTLLSGLLVAWVLIDAALVTSGYASVASALVAFDLVLGAAALLVGALSARFELLEQAGVSAATALSLLAATVLLGNGAVLWAWAHRRRVRGLVAAGRVIGAWIAALASRPT